MSLRDLMNWERTSDVPVRRGETKMFSSLASLQDEMNRLFDHLYRGSEVYLTKWGSKEMASPAVNIIENGDSFRVDAELPGIQPEAVEVSVTGGYLTIKGERKEEKEEKEGSYIRRESSFGSFYRQLSLPETADSDKAEASFKNGILTIKVPKKANAVQPTKKLQIKKAA